MPTADDLVGLAMPAQLASQLGNQPSSLACTGTTLGAAASIKTTNVEVVPSASNTGAVFQTSAKLGTPHYIFNAQSTGAVIYVPSGYFMNGTADATFTLAQNKSVVMWQYKRASGVGYWAANLTA